MACIAAAALGLLAGMVHAMPTGKLGGLTAAGAVHAQPQPSPTPFPPLPFAPPIYVPSLGFLGGQEVCETNLRITNTSSTPSKAVMVGFGPPGACAPNCDGPLKVECSGLLRPGASWQMLGAQIPVGTMSVVLYSFTAHQLMDMGIDLGFDDVVADLMCETLFFGVVGDCDDFRRFQKAFETGTDFAGVPQRLAYGGTLAVEVERDCAMAVGVKASASYNGLSSTQLGDRDPISTQYEYYAPVVSAGFGGMTTTLAVQNAGAECAYLEVTFRPDPPAVAGRTCFTATLSSGEAIRRSLAECAQGQQGSAMVRSTLPAAVTVDTQGARTLTTYVAPPADTTATGGSVMYAPLIYNGFQRWETRLSIQNVDPRTDASVKIYYLDRTGDILAVSPLNLPAGGRQTVNLAENPDLPGNWMGSARIESLWREIGGAGLAPARVMAVAEVERRNADGTMTDAFAYNALTESDGYDWPLAENLNTSPAAVTRSSGAALIAVPFISRPANGDAPDRVVTDLAIANLVAKPGFTQFAVYVFDQNGLFDAICQKLNEKEVSYLDLDVWGSLPPGFNGSALISAVYWEHNVYSADGTLLKNLVGLGAVKADRRGRANRGTFPPTPPGDFPTTGDRSSASVGIPLASGGGTDFYRNRVALPAVCGTITKPPVNPTPGVPQFPNTRGSIWLPYLANGDSSEPAQPTAMPPTAVPPTAVPPTKAVATATSTAMPTAMQPMTKTVAPYVEPSALVHLPALNAELGDAGSEARVAVQNVGAVASKVVLLTWDQAADVCTATCRGPTGIECSGLIRPGSNWVFRLAPGSPPAYNGQLYNFAAQDADKWCTLLRTKTVGQCDGYAAFRSAWDAKASFQGLSTSDGRGGPLAVEVVRASAKPPTITNAAAVDLTASYEGVPDSDTGVADPAGVTHYLPLIYAEKNHVNSTVHVQNAGSQCGSVELWLMAQDRCVGAQVCKAVSLSPGRTWSINLADCSQTNWWGAAWIRSTVPVAVAVDNQNEDSRSTYVGVSSAAKTMAGTVVETGSTVAYAPLMYSEYQGWDTDIEVQNLSLSQNAKVKVYFMDRAGDVITTLVDWVCPRGSQTFFLPVVHNLPGTWVGSVRVESQDWPTQTDGTVAAPPIAAVAQLIQYDWASRQGLRGATNYNLLSEQDAFVWKFGAGAGGLESGTGLIAIPSLGQLGDQPHSTVTEIGITNFVPAPGMTDCALLLFDANGQFGDACLQLFEHSTDYIDLAKWSFISPEFSGSALISATAWQHPSRDPADPRVERNLLGLGAVVVQRSGTQIGQDVPGDELSMSVGRPLRGQTAAQLAALLVNPNCPGPMAKPDAAIQSAQTVTGTVYLPSLRPVDSGNGGSATVRVQNVSAEPVQVVLLTLPDGGDCTSACSSPLESSCSGLLAPGRGWTFGNGAGQAWSGVLYSFGQGSAQAACEALAGVVGNCQAYTRFRQAYAAGAAFEGLDLSRARGGPIVAEVSLRGYQPASPGSNAGVTFAGYEGIPASGLGAAELDGRWRYPVPLAPSDTRHDTVLHLQNTGSGCATVDIWVRPPGACQPATRATIVVVGGTASVIVALSKILPPGQASLASAMLVSNQPLAVAVEVFGRGMLSAYTAAPTRAAVGSTPLVNGSRVLYAPLVFSEMQNWAQSIQVQNLDASRRAKVKVAFVDRSGDPVATYIDWICPLAAQAFVFPAVHDLPGTWVGAVRVESLAGAVGTAGGGGPGLDPPPLAAVAQLLKQAAPPDDTAPTEAVAYRLLPEAGAFDWRDGRAPGGTAGGAGVLAVSVFMKLDPADTSNGRVGNELAIANLVPQPGFTEFLAILMDQNGAIQSICQRLEAHEVEYIDSSTWGHAAPGFVGSMLISATRWTHEAKMPDGTTRDLVGLGAVKLTRHGTRLGEEIAGDELDASQVVALAPDVAAPLMRALFNGPPPPCLTPPVMIPTLGLR